MPCGVGLQFPNGRWYQRSLRIVFCWGDKLGAVAFLRRCRRDRIANLWSSLIRPPRATAVSDLQPTPDARREELRQRWLDHAAAAFDLMFRPEYQDQLVTFDQREERACELGRDLTTWLLQQHVNADAQARS